MAALGGAALAVAACGTSMHGVLAPDQRPTIKISSGPIERGATTYDVRVDWFASDPDGEVVKVLYAADPPVTGDTAWVTASHAFAQFTFDAATTDSILPPVGAPIISRGYHTVVLKAIDNAGLACRPVVRTFTATTVAPQTMIVSPTPTQEVAIMTPMSLVIQWHGVDPDGVSGQRPARFAYRLVTATDINPANPNGIPADLVQAYFRAGEAAGFPGWTFVGGDTSSATLTGLTPQVTYYFAIAAIDPEGAVEPRFDLNSNVLQFRPSLQTFGPSITVSNAYYAKRQVAGGVSLDPSRIYPFALPAGIAMTFDWSAQPGSQGAFVTGYRWALDLADSNVADSTAPSGPADVSHWSAWDLRENEATVGPFALGPGAPTDHLLYIEAEDSFGTISLLTLDLQVVSVVPTRSLLVVDDMYGTPTERNPSPPFVFLKGAYPMEAEQDSFYYAVGGFPDSLRILSGTPGAISRPGCFAGFDYDTLDYRFWPEEGLSYAELAHYRAVAIYSDQLSSANTGAKFGGNRPMTALRFMNTIGHENWLALYLKAGGRAWLFGDGTTTAIANGYYSRISFRTPSFPYDAGGDPRVDILVPGDFLHDFCHLQSELDLADRSGASALSRPVQLHACLPYLPQYALAPGDPVPADHSQDARVGPSSAKTAIRWSGLPRLTLAAFRGANIDPTQRGVAQTFVITQPNFITEGSGANVHSVMDTLYLCQALTYDPNDSRVPASDGRPNAVDYYGSEHGEVVWFGFPLYDFELDQARTVTSIVLTNLGVPHGPPGTGGAHPFRIAARR